MNPNKDDAYKKLAKIEETVWRSARLNDSRDELVVASGSWDGVPGYFMAWEIVGKRPETVSFDGEISWYPRMFWEQKEYKNSILVQDENEIVKQLIPGTKYYWQKKSNLLFNEKDGQYYIPLVQYRPTDDGLTIHKPYLQTDIPDALTSAINYVQWFNENHRQMTKFGKLLSTSKKAKKRRKKRLEKTLTLKRTTLDKPNYLST
tara:strand:+ start:306 stop:917 length:612 start_codon:yes stop_codon:yes gene_type:complete